MKLASLKEGGRDGRLIVVNKDLSKYIKVPEIAMCMQRVIENWNKLEPKLQQRYAALNSGEIEGENLIFSELASPFPRAYQWLDGSAYLSHVERVRKARGAEMPPSFQTDPLMYQGGSDFFLGPHDPIYAQSEKFGIDFESEIAVVTDDTPIGISPQQAQNHIKLLMLVNDVSLRNLIPNELAKGFGFLHGKPPTAFSPVAITPDELGGAWKNGKVHRPLITRLNEQHYGDPDAGVDMQFSFAELIAHAAKTRALSAGTIIGSGTVSNQDTTRGSSCLAEKRVLEIIDNGEASTSFMQFGDNIEIDMFDEQDNSIFGNIKQEIKPWNT